jgi:hypothetical protein
MYFDALYTYVCVIGMGHCEHLIRFKQQAIIKVMKGGYEEHCF